ncbi:MAG TPA: hypothetical protein VGC01_04900 [Mucilaginibacter sp.]
MTTSWNETEQIETYLNGFNDNGEALIFEAKTLLDPSLQDKIYWQQKTYELIQRYGRKQLKQEIEAIHQQLFTKPEHSGFRQKIRLLFTNR